MTLLCIAIYGLAAGAVLLAREPVLIRGETFLLLVGVLAGGEVLQVILGFGIPSLAEKVFWPVNVLLAVLVRSKWILWNIHAVAAGRIVERSMGMLRLPCRRVSKGYTVELGSGNARLELSPLTARTTILEVRGDRSHNKIRLLRRLIAKRFRPVFPRPSFDLRGRPHVES